MGSLLLAQLILILGLVLCSDALSFWYTHKLCTVSAIWKLVEVADMPSSHLEHSLMTQPHSNRRFIDIYMHDISMDNYTRAQVTTLM